MADVLPLKLVDVGGGQGALREFASGDKLPSAVLAANLAALAGLTGTANKALHFTGAGTMDVHDQTAQARVFMAASSTAAQRNSIGVGSGDSPTLTALTLTNGQLVFPASQVPSANANTLDDYEEGTWTPTLTFATPGDLSVSYAANTGVYTKIGRVVHASFVLLTTAFTHSTASGALRIAGLPIVPGAVSPFGSLAWAGITKASYTQHSGRANVAQSYLDFISFGSGQIFSQLVAADTPSGGTIRLDLSITYIT